MHLVYGKASAAVGILLVRAPRESLGQGRPVQIEGRQRRPPPGGIDRSRFNATSELNTEKIEQMTTYRTVPLDSEAAYSLAELKGIASDLTLTIMLSERALSTSAPLDPIASTGVSAAAVVRYARCFKSGVRPALPSSIIDSLSAELRDFHLFIIDLRDKFIAHSVNEYERNRMTVQVPVDPPPGWKPDGLGFHCSTVMLPAPFMLRQLIQLSLEVKKGTDLLIESEEPFVLAEVQQVPVLELAGREMLLVSPPNLHAVNKARPRGIKKRQ